MENVKYYCHECISRDVACTKTEVTREVEFPISDLAGHRSLFLRDGYRLVFWEAKCGNCGRRQTWWDAEPIRAFAFESSVLELRDKIAEADVPDPWLDEMRSKLDQMQSEITQLQNNVFKPEEEESTDA